ncbi:hypothetical protein NMY22_g5233 [Coprinellus aureogranulatus]|nr:hypothetical protein NMY22_g5233 [Coprinellus aureogranulatus]
MLTSLLAYKEEANSSCVPSIHAHCAPRENPRKSCHKSQGKRQGQSPALASQCIDCGSLGTRQPSSHDTSLGVFHDFHKPENQVHKNKAWLERSQKSGSTHTLRGVTPTGEVYPELQDSERTRRNLPWMPNASRACPGGVLHRAIDDAVSSET